MDYSIEGKYNQYTLYFFLIQPRPVFDSWMDLDSVCQWIGRRGQDLTYNFFAYSQKIFISESFIVLLLEEVYPPPDRIVIKPLTVVLS